MVVYPLAQRQQFNVALFTEFALPLQDDDTPEISNKSLSKNKLLSSIMDSISAPGTAWPLFGVRTDKWYQGNVAILGDAAHAMLPFQAQGAAMAIEDAGLLAAVMAASSDNKTAFSQWQKSASATRDQSPRRFTKERVCFPYDPAHELGARRCCGRKIRDRTSGTVGLALRP